MNTNQMRTIMTVFSFNVMVLFLVLTSVDSCQVLAIKHQITTKFVSGDFIYRASVDLALYKTELYHMSKNFVTPARKNCQCRTRLWVGNYSVGLKERQSGPEGINNIMK